MTSNEKQNSYGNYLEKFNKIINRWSLLFGDKDLEISYKRQMSKTYGEYNLFEIIMGITSLLIHIKIFICIIMGINRGGCKSFEIPLIVLLVITTLLFVVEIILYTKNYLKQIQGIFINIFPLFLYFFLYFIETMNGRPESVQNQNQADNKSPIHNNDAFSLFLVGIFCYNIICYYTYFWILKAIHIILDFLIVIIFYAILDHSSPLERIFNYLLLLSIAVFTIYSIYIKENEKRLLFFIIQEKQLSKENADELIKDLDFPVIKACNGKIQYSNTSYKQFLKTNPILKESIDNQVKKNNLSSLKVKLSLKNILSDSKKISLWNYIKNQKEINQEEENFTINLKPPIALTIKSSSFESSEGKCIAYFACSGKLDETVKNLNQKIQSMVSYLASVSHDFKTPLNVIIRRSSAILSIQGLPEDLGKEMRLIKDTAESILYNVQDIMDYSTLTTKKHLKICPLPFNFKESIINCCMAISNSINKSEIAFSVKIDPRIPDFIKTDQNRVKQVLTNLISNAYKFTLEGAILINISLMNSNIIEISVSDTGIGIKEEDIHKLFREFSTLDDPDNLNPLGVGLGLSICKNLSQLLGGDIRVESQIGKGSTFIFHFRFENVSLNMSRIPSFNQSFVSPSCIKKGDNRRNSEFFKNSFEEQKISNFEFIQNIIPQRDINTDEFIKVSPKLIKQENVERKEYLNIDKSNSYNEENKNQIVIKNNNNYLHSNNNINNQQNISIYEVDSSRKMFQENEIGSNTPIFHKVTSNPNMCQCSTVLIVDDEASNRAPIASYCKKQNLKFDEASNGKIAFFKVEEKFKSNCCPVYKFIFLDFNMPFMNGLETAIKIQEYENLMNKGYSKKIALSGNIEEFSKFDEEGHPNLFFIKCVKPLDAFTFNNIIHGDTYTAQFKSIKEK